MDSYYYYAACIFIMSAASISATLVETCTVSLPIFKISSIHTDLSRRRDVSVNFPDSSAMFECFEMDFVRETRYRLLLLKQELKLMQGNMFRPVI